MLLAQRRWAQGLILVVLACTPGVCLVWLPDPYEQQYQMDLFFKRFYEGTPVALKDIGAGSYLAVIECVDLAGLANMGVARRILNGEYETRTSGEITEASARASGSCTTHGRRAHSGQLAPSWNLDNLQQRR